MPSDRPWCVFSREAYERLRRVAALEEERRRQECFGSLEPKPKFVVEEASLKFFEAAPVSPPPFPARALRFSA